LGGRLSVHEQLFCATVPRRPQRGAGDSPSPVLVSARTCLSGHLSGEVFFAMICVDNVDSASAGLGDLVVSG
jgi:hypothetical protein